MVQEGSSRQVYPSDLTDEQWVIVEPMIPPAKQHPRGGRPREVDMREVLNTIFSLHRSGCQWDMLPHDLLPKSTVYDYFAQWRDDGTWAKVNHCPLKEAAFANKFCSPIEGSQSLLDWASLGH